MQVTVTMKWFIFIKVLCNLFMTVEMNSNDIHSDFMSYKLWGFVYKEMPCKLRKCHAYCELISYKLWGNGKRTEVMPYKLWGYDVQDVMLCHTRCKVMSYKLWGHAIHSMSYYFTRYVIYQCKFWNMVSEVQETALRLIQNFWNLLCTKTDFVQDCVWGYFQ